MNRMNNMGDDVKIVRPEYSGSRILVRLQPDEVWLSLPRPKLAGQLLAALDLPEEGALVARGAELLTPDRHIWPEDEILVRKVGSVG